MGGEHPAWLPVDWKVCVKIRNFGRKDKYYINPLNGLKFNSKLEVLRYLKNAGKDQKLKQLNEIGIKKTVAEKLPPGWIKEIRTKRKGGKTRRDPYYIDPVSGRHFRSMQEVFRFLESTDSGQDESKVDNQDHASEELGENSKPAIAGAKGQRLINKKADKIVNGNESIKSGSQGAAVKHINTLAEARHNENMSQQTKRKKSNRKWANDLPRRSSKRLARAEADQLLERKTSKQATELATLSGEAETITSGSFGNSCEPNKHRMKDRTETPTNDKPKESADLLLGDHASVLEEREDVAVDFKEDGKHERNLDSSLNDLLMDPCIEFAVKTLTGAIPIEEVNKVDDSPVSSLASPNQTSGSSFVLPSVDIWADPCFEFAVKTLTGEIPFENSSHFQITLQQPQSSSGASGYNSLDNSYSSSYSFSQFDVIMKQQLGVRESSLSHPMNGSSQKST
ncbi:UNVERIFIED_CONTAM: Methyl-CpG-binding domain-containing protein 13 [Sesamum latifolium]|uniref:Methyl-CpG-binding domain-containing protein 13 n=1 Tax=Sesamum latifolium TaxID=2727402 RepID=A0AAW2XFK7_9LAMI